MKPKYSDHCDVGVLLGQTLVAVGVNTEKDEICFETSDGRKYLMFHSQGCCESVSIEDIVGDLNDLLGEPLLVAEEVSSEGTPAKDPKWDESFTWTFYKFATRKGYVDIRWYGTSNGYYSEAVDFGLVRQ